MTNLKGIKETGERRKERELSRLTERNKDGGEALKEGDKNTGEKQKEERGGGEMGGIKTTAL